MEKQKITVYSTSEFFGSVVKHEGFLVEHGLTDYAQYKNTPYVVFVPKGKRKAVRILKGYNPFILILKGWNNPESDGMFSKEVKQGEVIVKTSKYASFDDRYKTDFNSMINPLLNKTCEVVADYRHIK